MPSGTKFATRVGRPMPRFTAMPSRSSLATRMAISSLVKPAGVMLRSLHDAVDVNAGRDHQLRVQITRIHKLLDFSDGHACCRRHHLVEVARRLAVDQVAVAVSAKRLNEGVVGRQA